MQQASLSGEAAAAFRGVAPADRYVRSAHSSLCGFRCFRCRRFAPTLPVLVASLVECAPASIFWDMHASTYPPSPAIWNASTPLARVSDWSASRQPCSCTKQSLTFPSRFVSATHPVFLACPSASLGGCPIEPLRSVTTRGLVASASEKHRFHEVTFNQDLSHVAEACFTTALFRSRRYAPRNV